MNGLLEEREKQNLLIRIALHRLCAILTIIIVLLCILFIDHKAISAIFVLLGMLVVEFIWCILHLRIKGRPRSNSNINSKKLLLRFIENNFELKYKNTKYPGLPLFIEGIVLMFLCTVSGGINSPFFSLFAIFSVLGLYVLNRRNPLLAIIDVGGLCLCFAVIVWGEKWLGKYLTDLYLTTKALQGNHPEISFIIAIYALAMTCTAFYNIAAHYAEQEEEISELPFHQTKDFLWTQKQKKQIESYGRSKDGHVFIIGNNPSPLNPEGTLALLPYCSRGSHCPIRWEDEHCTQSPTTTDGCRYCDIACHIGELFKLRGEKIAEIKVIGSSHKIDDVIKEFRRNDRKLTHVIAVCCTSNLAKYLAKGMQTHKNVTVIYTPVIVGSEICVSSTNPNFHGRPPSPLPCTSFDSGALVKYLTKEPKPSIQ